MLLRNLSLHVSHLLKIFLRVPRTQRVTLPNFKHLLLLLYPRARVFHRASGSTYFISLPSSLSRLFLFFSALTAFLFLNCLVPSLGHSLAFLSRQNLFSYIPPPYVNTFFLFFLVPLTI